MRNTANLNVLGGALIGAGTVGASSLNPNWGWCIVLGAACIFLAVAVEFNSPK